MTYGNTLGQKMPKAKIAISIDEEALGRLDGLVRSGVFRTRSQAIERAVVDTLEPPRAHPPRRSSAPSSMPAVEKDLAEEGLTEEVAEWPEY